MSAATPHWPGYVQVPGLANRLIARYLRTSRKTMRRFFAEHGQFDLVDRMDRIRKANKSMLEKNRMFQGVLDDYARRASPTVVPEAADQVAEVGRVGAGSVAVLPEGALVRPAVGGPGPDASGGVQELAIEDGGSAVVIEE